MHKFAANARVRRDFHDGAGRVAGAAAVGRGIDRHGAEARIARAHIERRAVRDGDVELLLGAVKVRIAAVAHDDLHRRPCAGARIEGAGALPSRDRDLAPRRTVAPHRDRAAGGTIRRGPPHHDLLSSEGGCGRGGGERDRPLADRHLGRAARRGAVDGIAEVSGRDGSGADRVPDEVAVHDPRRPGWLHQAGLTVAGGDLDRAGEVRGGAGVVRELRRDLGRRVDRRERRRTDRDLHANALQINSNSISARLEERPGREVLGDDRICRISQVGRAGAGLRSEGGNTVDECGRAEEDQRLATRRPWLGSVERDRAGGGQAGSGAGDGGRQVNGADTGDDGVGRDIEVEGRLGPGDRHRDGRRDAFVVERTSDVAGGQLCVARSELWNALGAGGIEPDTGRQGCDARDDGHVARDDGAGSPELDPVVGRDALGDLNRGHEFNKRTVCVGRRAAERHGHRRAIGDDRDRVGVSLREVAVARVARGETSGCRGDVEGGRRHPIHDRRGRDLAGRRTERDRASRAGAEDRQRRRQRHRRSDADRGRRRLRRRGEHWRDVRLHHLETWSIWREHLTGRVAIVAEVHDPGCRRKLGRDWCECRGEGVPAVHQGGFGDAIAADPELDSAGRLCRLGRGEHGAGVGLRIAVDMAAGVRSGESSGRLELREPERQ